MIYDFDNLTTRLGSSSVKWDGPADPDILPMWVADMDFEAALPIIEAMKQRLKHGVFGYSAVGDDYREAVANWYHTRHQWRPETGHMVFTTGVVPALVSALLTFTRPGNKVIVQSPAYNCFFACVETAKCQLSANLLSYDPATGAYQIDFDDLEKRAADPEATMMILCNPHNPTGNLWTEQELRRIAKICAVNGVTVVADEIHCEFTFNGQRYTPFAPIAQEEGCRYVVANSASKAFNIAGLHLANMVCPDPEMRSALEQTVLGLHCGEINPFGICGAKAAYTDGAEWLDQMLAYVWGNYQLLRSRIDAEAPDYKLTPLQSTYLGWIDITPKGMASQRFVDAMVKATHLLVSAGCIYGPGGDSHIRFNLATQRSRVDQGINRLMRFIAD